jgi:class 3 adenylate cyclase
VSHRTLTTVLFTDIVGSTERAASLGDAGWRRLLERHNTLARAQFERHGGREVKTTGDGFLVTFTSPARAIECARMMIELLRADDNEIRTGIHTGECDVIDGHDVGGMAVHIAARVMEICTAGEVCVSGTVKDLVIGSDYSFDTRGAHALKGVPGSWDVWAIADRRQTHGAEEIRERPLRASDRIALFLARRAPRALRRLAAMAVQEG